MRLTERNAEGGAEPERDESLVAKAREGDEAAFYELVRRHRRKACGVARSLLRDEHLAEDIVQEALIRAFLQLGTLVDGSRFLPWFQRIVRTQAWMKLRRGGLYRRELPFTGLTLTRGHGEDGDSPGGWDSVDGVIHRLRQRSAHADDVIGDPSGRLLRKELLDTIGGMLACLSRKEREIFEAHFFGELSPQEIAELFRTTAGNVYTSLSRSRAKLQQERLRVSVRGYVHRRRTEGKPVRRVLDASAIQFN